MPSSASDVGSHSLHTNVMTRHAAHTGTAQAAHFFCFCFILRKSISNTYYNQTSFLAEAPVRSGEFTELKAIHGRNVLIHFLKCTGLKAIRGFVDASKFGIVCIFGLF